MEHSYFLSYRFRWLLILMAVLLLNLLHPSLVFPFQRVSLKTYPNRATKTSNPIDLTRLSRKDTYQINDPHFILQFFFSGPNILGIILKRDKRYPIKVRWCFFRDCEESPFDYSVVIAEAFNPPFVEGFFEVKFPPGLRYNFQGLFFSSKK